MSLEILKATLDFIISIINLSGKIYILWSFFKIYFIIYFPEFKNKERNIRDVPLLLKGLAVCVTLSSLNFMIKSSLLHIIPFIFGSLLFGFLILRSLFGRRDQ